MKPQALLPHNKADDRPLFMILVILAFLASLTLLAVASGHRATTNWQNNLGGTVTVQVKPDSSVGTIEQAGDIIANLPPVKNVTILPPEHSRELLAPWFGNTPLPADLPLPVLLDVQLKDGEKLDSKKAADLLVTAGFNVSIDDHSQWDKQIERTTGAAKLLSVSALLLIVIASIAASIYATRAGITGHRHLIDVLNQIGAPPVYTARLLSSRFAWSGFKAGAFGALAALMIAVMMRLLFSSYGASAYFLPGPGLQMSDVVLLVVIPVVLALITAFASWRTVVRTLYREIYP